MLDKQNWLNGMRQFQNTTGECRRKLTALGVLLVMTMQRAADSTGQVVLYTACLAIQFFFLVRS